jgi:hypothetical protein
MCSVNEGNRDFSTIMLTHSPWISRVLGELGHEVIVGNARKLRLIGESRKKDDRLDAQMLVKPGPSNVQGGRFSKWRIGRRLPL